VALLGGERGIVAQPPKDVFHIDHGIIDQRPDGDGHTAQGHGIHRRPKNLQDEHRREQRQGNGGQCNEGGSEVGQKEEHNHHDQEAAVKMLDAKNKAPREPGWSPKRVKNQ
jgi:hypothetical protein